MPRHAMDQKRFFMGFLDTININAGCGGAKVGRSKEVNRSPASFQGKNNAPVFCASGQSRRGHALTLDRRRDLRGVCKSWPQGGSSRGGQAELVKKSPVLMGRPLIPHESSRHGATSNVADPVLERRRPGSCGKLFGSCPRKRPNNYPSTRLSVSTNSRHLQ